MQLFEPYDHAPCRRAFQSLSGAASCRRTLGRVACVFSLLPWSLFLEGDHQVAFRVGSEFHVENDALKGYVVDVLPNGRARDAGHRLVKLGSVHSLDDGDDVA